MNQKLSEVCQLAYKQKNAQILDTPAFLQVKLSVTSKIQIWAWSCSFHDSEQPKSVKIFEGDIVLFLSFEA